MPTSYTGNFSGRFKDLPLDISNTFVQYITNDASENRILIGKTNENSDISDGKLLLYNEGKSKFTNDIEIVNSDVSFNSGDPDKRVHIGCDLSVKNLILNYSDISDGVDESFFNDYEDTGVIDTLLFINQDGEIRSTGMPYTKLQYANQIGFDNNMISIFENFDFAVVNPSHTSYGGSDDNSYNFIVKRTPDINDSNYTSYEASHSYTRVGINVDNPSVILDISGTDAIQIPVGISGERPSNPKTGMIRYNTTASQYEGYGGSAWQGLGGVIDIDKNTYILAENSPNADNDELKFFTGDYGRMIIDASGNINIKNTDLSGEAAVTDFEYTNYKVNIDGSVNITNNLDISGTVNFGKYISIQGQNIYGSLTEFEGNNQDYLNIQTDVSDSFIMFRPSKTTIMMVTQYGLNIGYGKGYGNDTDNGYKLDVSGNVNITGTTTIGENIEENEEDPVLLLSKNINMDNLNDTDDIPCHLILHTDNIADEDKDKDDAITVIGFNHHVNSVLKNSLFNAIYSRSGAGGSYSSNGITLNFAVSDVISNDADDGDIQYKGLRKENLESNTHLTIKQGGYVGINNISPSVDLDVTGDTSISGYTRLGTCIIDNYSSGSTNYSYLIHEDISNSYEYSFAIRQNNSGGTAINSASGSTITFNINNDGKMNIDSNGDLNVLNNATIGGGLDVSGNVNVNGMINNEIYSSSLETNIGSRFTVADRMFYANSVGDKYNMTSSTTTKYIPLYQFSSSVSSRIHGTIRKSGGGQYFTVDLTITPRYSNTPGVEASNYSEIHTIGEIRGAKTYTDTGPDIVVYGNDNDGSNEQTDNWYQVFLVSSENYTIYNLEIEGIGNGIINLWPGPTSTGQDESFITTLGSGSIDETRVMFTTQYPNYGSIGDASYNAITIIDNENNIESDFTVNNILNTTQPTSWSGTQNLEQYENFSNNYTNFFANGSIYLYKMVMELILVV